MASEELIISTIKRMVESGIEDSVIAATLKDIGLKQAEIDSYIAKVRGKPVSKKPIRKEKDSGQETQELLHTTTHNKLDEHTEKLEGVGKEVSTIQQKIASVTSGPDNKKLFDEITLLSQRMAQHEKQISDLKALNSAMKSLLEKILETNKGILEKL